MDFNISRMKGFNLLLIILIAVQFILLVMTSMIFLFSSVYSEFPFSTIIAAAFLLLFCVPICIVIYRSSTDKISKTMFLGLSISYFALALSGIIWYLLPITYNVSFLVPLGKILMVFNYFPIIIALSLVYKEQGSMFKSPIKIFIFYLAFAFVLLLIYYSIINISSFDQFDVSIYTISTVCDAIIIALSIILIIN